MPEWPPLEQLAAGVNAADLSAEEQVHKSLQAIAKAADYQAVISTTAERARQRAADLDKRVAAGQSGGRLAGVPFVAKDNFLAFGAETTAASRILKGFEAPYQASAIEKLEAEGAICVAKANLDAFAHGSSTENSDWFVTKNPHDRQRVAGGSSGGSAAAVALGLAPFALGTDTGGSIRLPASFCGVVGYKPTYGLVSRSGVIAMASSTDVVGPLATRVSDAALVLDVMAGPDGLDATLIPPDEAGYHNLNLSLKGLKIGLINEYMSDGLEPAVRAATEKSVERLRAAGAEVYPISLPSVSLALAVYYIICPAEVSSNLSRYDGQRFGYSDPAATSLEESYSLSRGRGFGDEAKRRILIGTYVLSSGYYDAYYKQAQTVRSKLIAELQSAFEKVELLVGPTAPMTAFKIGQNSDDPLKMYLSDIMTVAANITGVPAISLPAGRSGELPVGIQFMARQGDDRTLLAAAQAFEGLNL